METNIEGLLLPKFVSSSISLKFVENIEDGSVRGLYSYPKNLTDENDVSSQHAIYKNPNKIEYYITNPEGELKKGTKDDYINGRTRRTIKIKTTK